jgi:dTDP-4-amino-4,6-dideoxygalactose transaminase
MLNTSFSPWPSFTEEEAEAAKQIILSNKVNYWTGQECREFEKEFAAWSETKYAIAVANGTLALDACLAALKIGTGDEVIVTSRTFLASASAIANTGAQPVFADIDRNSQNITAATIEPLITSKTSAILCVHLAGWPCEMDEINQLAKTHKLKVIEDCAQAHGAIYKGKHVGSLGDIAAWSFCQDKIMTTGGEGGMVTTNDETLWNRVWSLKDHGRSWDAVYNRTYPPGFNFRWQIESFGHNWRMMETQAAIGRIQLKRMEKWTADRTKNARIILETAKDLTAIRTPTPPVHIDHAWYKCYIFVATEALKPEWNRNRIMNEINALGVPCFQGACPEVYLEKCFDNTDFRPTTRLPIAKELGDTSLMFLVHPTLTQEEIDRTCDAIQTVAKNAQR